MMIFFSSKLAGHQLGLLGGAEDKSKTKKGPESPLVDYSVQVSHLDRNDIVEKLKNFGLANVTFNREALRRSLAKKLKKDHPIHIRLEMLSNMELFDLRHNLIQTTFKKDRKRVLSVIANYFFKTFPEAPLSNLDRILEKDNYFTQLTSHSGNINASWGNS